MEANPFERFNGTGVEATDEKAMIRRDDGAMFFSFYGSNGRQAKPALVVDSRISFRVSSSGYADDFEPVTP